MISKMKKKDQFKVGKVAIVGRPNVGKSTLMNSLVEHKVSIVSEKPQTTRTQIVAYLENEQGQIFFLDTPGFYSARAGTTQYNSLIAHSIEEADLIVYLVDHTRDWGQEEERIWNLIEYSEKPVILAVNKIDQENPSFKQSYLTLLSDKVREVIEISALREQHLKKLIELIFKYLPAGIRDSSVDYFPTPLLSQDSKEYLAEIVREKVYQHTGQEVPYQTAVRIQDISENEETNTIRIEGEIRVREKRYKPILIGKEGRKISEIRNSVRKELMTATGKNVHIALRVVVD